MNLNQLAKELQDILREGVLTVYIFKIGKSWEWVFAEIDNREYDLLNTDEEKGQLHIDLNSKFLDQHGIVLNGHESIANTSIKGIASQIKYHYENTKYRDFEHELETTCNVTMKELAMFKDYVDSSEYKENRGIYSYTFKDIDPFVVKVINKLNGHDRKYLKCTQMGSMYRYPYISSYEYLQVSKYLRKILNCIK